MGFLEGLAQFAVRKDRISFKIDLPDTHPGVSIDHKGHIDRILNRGVILLTHIHRHIAEALFRIELSDEIGRVFEQIIRQIAASFQIQFFLQIAQLTLPHPLIFPLIHPRTFLQKDLQIDTIAYRLCDDFDIGIKVLIPHLPNGR